jgi:hypothetical protein
MNKIEIRVVGETDVYTTEAEVLAGTGDIIHISEPGIVLYCIYFGPSGVRALPLASGINVGGHYKGHFFLSFLSSSGLIANSHIERSTDQYQYWEF